MWNEEMNYEGFKLIWSNQSQIWEEAYKKAENEFKEGKDYSTFAKPEEEIKKDHAKIRSITTLIKSVLKDMRPRLEEANEILIKRPQARLRKYDEWRDYLKESEKQFDDYVKRTVTLFMKVVEVIEKLDKLAEMKGMSNLAPIDYNLIEFQETREEDDLWQREAKNEHPSQLLKIPHLGGSPSWGDRPWIKTKSTKKKKRRNIVTRKSKDEEKRRGRIDA